MCYDASYKLSLSILLLLLLLLFYFFIIIIIIIIIIIEQFSNRLTISFILLCENKGKVRLLMVRKIGYMINGVEQVTEVQGIRI